MASKTRLEPPNTLMAERVAQKPVRTPRPGGTVVLRQTARRAVRSGVVWGYIFGIFVASSAVSYNKIYKTEAERLRLAAAFGSNKATGALFGPAPKLQTVAGFTVFKTFITLSILGAVWGLLTSTKLLRGEEEAGRWEILLTGQTTRKGAAAQALVGLGAGVTTVWGVTALVAVLTGRYSNIDIAAGPALFFALALVSSAIMFLSVGALTSQLAATRRQAAAYAGAFLGVSYALRMVADSGTGLHGLVWASPLGWVEQLQPLTASHPVALLPITGFTIVVTAAAVLLAGSRDVGASTLPDRIGRPPHLRLLFGQTGLTIRLIRPTVVSWWCAIAATGLLMGFVAKAAGATISGSSVQRVFAKLGAPGTGVDAYLGVATLILAVLVAFVAAGQVTSARTEEAQGRLDHLVVRPVSRSSWLGGRLGVAVLVVGAGAIIAGTSTWLGATSQGAAVSFRSLVEAGVNVVPPAVCIVGVGALTIGLWPRATSIVVYGVVGWSLLVELVGGIGALSHWILDTSVFHQMAAAPAVAPNWTTDAVMVAVGVLAATVGGIAFMRRDIQGE